MIKFVPAIETDLPQIQEWIDKDEDHQNRMGAEWWLTGSDCVIAFCVDDDLGPTMYVRMDKEGELARMHTQFAPQDEVPKKRLIASLLEGFPRLAKIMKVMLFKGIVFESTSESLVKFMSTLGFKPMGGKENIDDYVLVFEEK